MFSPPAKSLPSKQQVNTIIRRDISKTQLVKYLYGCVGSLAVSTWQHAVKNANFITWPGIDTLSTNAHFPDSIDSNKGHLDQERKNLQSTPEWTFPAMTATTTIFSAI